MSDSPRIEFIARGVATRDGRVLICRSVKHGYGYLPGGHVEFGEPASEALAREIREELGLSCRVGNCLLVTEESFREGHAPHHEVNLVFHVEQLGDAPGPPAAVASTEPKIVFEWLEPAALVNQDIRPPTIKAWLIAGGAGSLGWVSGMNESA